MKYLLGILAACALTFTATLYYVSVKIEKGYQFQSVNHPQVTKVVIYDGGCFDAKSGKHILVRCI